MAAKGDKSVRFEAEESAEEAAEQEDRLEPQFNKFQLLREIDAGNQLDDGDDDEVGEPHQADSSSECENRSDQQPKKSTSKSGGSSRSRNRGKRGHKQKATKDAVKDDDSNLDKASTSEQTSQSQTQIGQTSAPTSATKYSLLKLDPRNLVPSNEIKRIFGKEVLREERAKEFRSEHPVHGSGFRSRFVGFNQSDVRYQLQMITTGLSMELDEALNSHQTTSKPSGSANRGNSRKNFTSFQSRNDSTQNLEPTYYRFVHDKPYQLAQAHFLVAAHGGHPEVVDQNLRFYPTHVESLIQLSDMCRVAEDYKAAAELVERALLVFERGFHPRFNITQATCRLTYKRPENRTFFIALFKHTNYCNRRGLRRTPLEYTKLLLSLDPGNDPLFATLLLDFYALRSGSYDYLIDFAASWQHLSRLPNMNFSLALAHFLRSSDTKRGKVKGDESTSDELLQQALIRYPNFIIPLLDECGAEPDAGLKQCDYFDYSVYSKKYKTVPESVDLLISLYVQRTSILWKAKPVLSWLERNVATLVRKFTSKELIDRGQQREYWSCFNGPAPKNLLRHIVLSDLKVKVPPSATNSPIFDIDPYPPESIVSYQIETGAASANAPAANSSTRTFPDLLLRSFLPGFTTEGQPGAQPDGPNANRLHDATDRLEQELTWLEDTIAHFTNMFGSGASQANPEQNDADNNEPRQQR